MRNRFVFYPTDPRSIPTTDNCLPGRHLLRYIDPRDPSAGRYCDRSHCTYRDVAR